LVQSVLDPLALVDVKGVIFTGGGEPTLYRELSEAMAYCRELGIDFALNTNGRGLCHGLVRRIMPLNPRYIRLSLNAGSPEIQRLVTGIDDFELIIENIKQLVRSKAACNATTDISIGYVINVVNLYDILGIVCKMCEIERSLRSEEIEDSIYSIRFRPVGNYESSKNYSKKMVSEIMKHLRVIGGEERAQEFWRFMNEGEQCSARVLDQALEVLDGEAAKLIGEWGSNIRLVYPRHKFKYLPQVAYKPYDRIYFACPVFYVRFL
jgi:MoaA/NifB/PqqE/SkfB family radical SAM enzyme